jgi:surfeit locus 1 family protein
VSGLSRALLVVCVAVATSVLLALGFWQVSRLAWKEALIAEIAARTAAPPLALAEIEARWQSAGDVDYLPVRLAGEFRHDRETRFYATSKGRSGWQIMTPLQLADGSIVVVDRGFVPAALAEPAGRAAGQVAGTVEFSGLARNPQFAPPNRFVPANEPGNRLFFWKDFAAIAQASGIGKERLVPFMVDAGPAPIPGGWPQGGATIVELPNNHLQYAITWFGLAAACLGVGAALLFKLVSGGASSNGK